MIFWLRSDAAATSSQGAGSSDRRECEERRGLGDRGRDADGQRWRGCEQLGIDVGEGRGVVQDVVGNGRGRVGVRQHECRTALALRLKLEKTDEGGTGSETRIVTSVIQVDSTLNLKCTRGVVETTARDPG